MAKPLSNGEVKLELGGSKFILRSSFEAVRQIETRQHEGIWDFFTAAQKRIESHKFPFSMTTLVETLYALASAGTDNMPPLEEFGDLVMGHSTEVLNPLMVSLGYFILLMPKDDDSEASDEKKTKSSEESGSEKPPIATE